MVEMYKIYIGYEKEDDAFAKWLVRQLETYRTSSISRLDIEWIYPDRRSLDLIERAIHAADAVLVIVPRDGDRRYEWVRRDVLIARQLRKPIFPLVTEGVRLPDFLADLAQITLRDYEDVTTEPHIDVEDWTDKLSAKLRLSFESPESTYLIGSLESPVVNEEEDPKSAESERSRDSSWEAAEAVTQNALSEAADEPPPQVSTSELPELLRSQISARAWSFENTGEIPAYLGSVMSSQSETSRVEAPVSSTEDASRPAPNISIEASKKILTAMWFVRYALIAGAIAIGVWLGAKLLPMILGITSSAKSRRQSETSSKTQPVDCSVFAPPNIAPGSEMLVQVFLHPPGKAKEAGVGARLFDSDAEWRGFASLSLELSIGDRVGVQLDVGNLDVSDEGVGEIRWSNTVVGLSFIVRAPENARLGKHHATARFLVGGIPVGRIHFVIEVVSSADATTSARGTGDSIQRFRNAFISYASEDRAEVLKRVQTLVALKIDYFQDVLDLEPGDRWRQALYAEIEQSDLFLLFWSSAAKKSRWVRKEARYALSCQTRTGAGQPEIVPIMIEGPPPPRPWPECAHLHFNDKLIYLMRVDEDQIGSRPES